MESKNQIKTISSIKKIMEIFKNSQGEIRPHFFLTGSSGSGKSFTIQSLCDEVEIDYVEINAAQLTKEGISGNSLSKALVPLGQAQGKPVICFVDEMDKLFISGNSNKSLAHESTNGVQNEFLKVLESDEASVFGQYGHFDTITVKNVLFLFAGAFNNEPDITLDKLREFGVKTEFLGRVGLTYSLKKLSVEDLIEILKNSPLLKKYLELFEDVDEKKCVSEITNYVKENYENNSLGARMIMTLIHQWFINGGELGSKEVESITFQNKLKLGK